MWFKVDDQLHSHPKARKAGLEAMGLWAISGSWSMCYKTDGFIPGWFVAGQRGGDTLAAALVSAGLWHAASVDGEGGWRFRDWDDYQPLSDEIERVREQSRTRQRASRERRSTGKPKAVPGVEEGGAA